ncbi:GPP34 family phosphoprotein [Micromonospora aurantiaca (nom. illeg.)]|uniref:GPP34 family phosphoprotein n=1 Tax=Micromonospora aurantiaca (nom. illeg.) TaxID=47850 RepID=UPI0033F90CF5
MLGDDFFGLAHDDVTGKPRPHTSALSVGCGAALLAELISSRHIEVVPDATERPVVLRRHAQLVLARGVDEGQVNMTDDYAAVAVWYSRLESPAPAASWVYYLQRLLGSHAPGSRCYTPTSMRCSRIRRITTSRTSRLVPGRAALHAACWPATTTGSTRKGYRPPRRSAAPGRARAWLLGWGMSRGRRCCWSPVGRRWGGCGGPRPVASGPICCRTGCARTAPRCRCGVVPSRRHLVLPDLYDQPQTFDHLLAMTSRAHPYAPCYRRRHPSCCPL